jgi:hypothetical protein
MDIRAVKIKILVVVVGLVCANDPESYVGSSIATGRASQAKKVEG